MLALNMRTTKELQLLGDFVTMALDLIGGLPSLDLWLWDPTHHFVQLLMFLKMLWQLRQIV